MNTKVKKSSNDRLIKSVTGYHYKDLAVVNLGTIYNVEKVSEGKEMILHIRGGHKLKGPIHLPLVASHYSNKNTRSVLQITTKKGIVFYTTVDFDRVHEIKRAAGTYSEHLPNNEILTIKD